MISITDTVNYELGLNATGGPSLEAANHFEAEAYDKITITAVKNSVLATVNVQGGLNTKLKGLMIKSSAYDLLTFTVDADPTIFTLDGPLCLIGPGNLGMLGATINVLKFTNANVTVDKTIIIICARTAKT